ncbi:MAG: type VI secretion system membrane subunit TssM [Rhizobiales bacterium]|nr:type VI secretion system membrane subunit TssM [Hyphomicrobiales bacterium]
MIWAVRAFSLLALAGFAAAVWYAGPLIGFDDARPLEPAWIRITIIAVSVALPAAYYAVRFWLRRRAARALEAAVAAAADEDIDAPVLEERMKAALAALRRGSGRRDFLYEVPWYVIIGPPGAGKTTALVNSGLNFPLAGTGPAEPVAGVGGTRNCDWWFTDGAVLIDTAGRYVTQDSDAEKDKRSWIAFLTLLKKYRARQPINGVILGISLADMMTLDAAGRAAHAIEIRNRLDEIRQILRIAFPVYVLFTKADLVSGFMQYFGSFDEVRRREVWGATFQTSGRTQNMVGAVRQEFDALIERLAAEVPDRLQEEADPADRVALFAFCAQMEALKERLAAFLDDVFDPARPRADATMRGFYFSSGTQEGTPIDQVLGALGRGFGRQAEEHLSGSGKSFFLHDLLAKVAFEEAGWVSRDAAVERRAALVRGAGLGAVMLAAAAGLGAIGLSFAQNRLLVADTRQAAAQYRGSAAALLANTTVSTPDLETVIEALDALRNLPAGYSSREAATPVMQTLGLGQRERLLSAGQSAYRLGLERLLRPRLLLEVEQAMQRRMAEPTALYQPLKVYMMLGGAAPKVDDGLVTAWFRKDWENNRYPGANNRAGRAELEKHLGALLDLGAAYDPTYKADMRLVEAAQRSVGRLNVADRAAAIIASSPGAAELKDFSVAERAGPDAAFVFEPVGGGELASLRVPGLYTYAGFNDYYLAQLSQIAQRLVEDRWVLGGGAEQVGFDQDLAVLGPQLLERYGQDFASAWNDLLARLKFRNMADGKPDYPALAAAASSTSPVAALFQAVAEETALSREPADASAEPLDEKTAEAEARGLSRIGIQIASRKSQARAGALFTGTQARDPRVNIAAQFRPYQLLVAGAAGQRPIDVLVQNFRDIYQSLKLAAAMPAQAERLGSNLQVQIATLRANATRLPKALNRMASAVADDFEGDVVQTSLASLDKQLDETVTQPCAGIIAGRFPFSPDSAEDVSIADFARLFAPGGMMDRFYAQNLASLVDTSGKEWEWKKDSRLGRDLSKAALKSFQTAAAIRNAFFAMGRPLPAIELTLTPVSLQSDIDMALLNADGKVLQSYQSGNVAGTLPWPGDGGSPLASLSLTPELPGRESALRFEGAWALKRLLDRAQVVPGGDSTGLRFVIGGRDVTYSVPGAPDTIPLLLPALAAFTCPQTF